MTPAEQFAEGLAWVLAQRGVENPYDFVIFGSAVMKLHGLRDVIGDVDLFVTAPLFAHLRDDHGWTEMRPEPEDPPFLEVTGIAVADGPVGPHLVGVRYHAFYAWTARDLWISAPDAFAQREVVHGLPCIPLTMVAQHKHEAITLVAMRGIELEGSPWEKHLHDLRVLSDAGVNWSGR